MTYQHYSDHIKLCAYLGKEPVGEFKEFYDFITELWKDMHFTVINEHNKQGIIFHKGSGFFMEQDFNNGRLRCERDRVWSFFQTKKSMEYTETQDFIQSMVGNYLKSNVLTPMMPETVPRGPGGKLSQTPGRGHHHIKPRVGNYLKSNVLTPYLLAGVSKNQVEDHLKCQVPNPVRDSSPDDYWENIIKTVTKNTGNS